MPPQSILSLPFPLPERWMRRKPLLAAWLEQHRRGGLAAVYVASRTDADSIPGIANRFWDLVPLRRDQKLFPHFGEAGTAIFAVEEVEYGGHDQPRCLIYTISPR